MVETPLLVMVLEGLGGGDTPPSVGHLSRLLLELEVIQQVLL